MDYQTIRQRLEDHTDNVATDRQILSVIAIAIIGIAETVNHISAQADRQVELLTRIEAMLNELKGMDPDATPRDDGGHHDDERL
ncbi:hypothetical protein [Bifidobacterium callitrichos]|uniref:Uncharacterized protein n=1 Tax=Bifidobacterium callitrichos DSM 23973 TaxID=1437609 RepID=A0A087A911_9BIFI|nr:hypothetical protein [Bifidobacterium callitrichos]KFI55261.1 hypothetical protein BCAL_1277 [Bifidobacterium callitrichos DSM 23973]